LQEWLEFCYGVQRKPLFSQNSDKELLKGHLLMDYISDIFMAKESEGGANCFHTVTFNPSPKEIE
jgi:hypothetical protein